VQRLIVCRLLVIKNSFHLSRLKVERTELMNTYTTSRSLGDFLRAEAGLSPLRVDMKAKLVSRDHAAFPCTFVTTEKTSTSMTNDRGEVCFKQETVLCRIQPPKPVVDSVGIIVNGNVNFSAPDSELQEWMLVDPPSCSMAVDICQENETISEVKKELAELRTRITHLENGNRRSHALGRGDGAQNRSCAGHLFLSLPAPNKKINVITSDMLQQRKKYLRKSNRRKRSIDDLMDKQWVIVKEKSAFQKELLSRVRKPSLRPAKHLQGKRRRADPHKLWLVQFVKDVNAAKLKLRTPTYK